VDGDADGWCAVTAAPGLPATLNDPNDGNVNIMAEDYDLVFPMSIAHSGSGATPPMRQPVQVCNDGIDNDGDTFIDNNDAPVGAGTCRQKGPRASELRPARRPDAFSTATATDEAERSSAPTR
jgi:hypothetical protein